MNLTWVLSNCTKSITLILMLLNCKIVNFEKKPHVINLHTLRISYSLFHNPREPFGGFTG